LPVTYDDARALRESLEADYSERHATHRQLRDFWHGRYWNNGGSEDARGMRNSSISSIFRDLRARSSDFGPDVLLIHNVLQQVCVKYQTYLSPLPMIRVYTDTGDNQDLKRKQATLKERYLYGLWEAGNMDQIFNKAAWYLPLMGDAFLGIWPDFDSKMPVPIIRSPEYAYPLPSFDGQSTDAIIFCWKISEGQAARTFGYVPDPMQPKRNWFSRGPAKEGDISRSVEVMEYSDENEFHRWVQGKEVNGVVHGLGFNIFDQMGFIGVPDEPWNHSAVEQAVSLVEMGNALYSLLFQAVYDNVFPKLVLKNPAMAPEQIEMGPGAVIPVNEGGDVQWLHPPVEAVQSQVGFLGVNDQNIKQATAMPDVNFGQFRASIITGKAINELQGAGTGSTVEMVQACGLGDAIVKWNQKAIYMGQNMFPTDSIRLFGQIPLSMADLNPRNFSLTLKGQQLIGSGRNDVIFMPALNMHEKIVMNLQMAGGGLVSKKYQREQVGIPDNEAMSEEMVQEAFEDAVVGGLVNQFLQSGAQPGQAAGVEQQAIGYLAGATPGGAGAPGGPPALPPGPPGPGGAPPPGGGGPGGGGGGPVYGPLQPGATGQAVSPALRMPPGAPPPGGGPPVGAGAPGPAPEGATPPEVPPEAPTQTPGTISLQQAADAVRAVDGITGKVWLVGQIVDEGEANASVEIDVSKTEDKQTLTDALPFPTTIHVVTSPPSGEPFLDVSPGTDGYDVQNAGASGPSGPSPEEMMGGGGPPAGP